MDKLVQDPIRYYELVKGLNRKILTPDIPHRAISVLEFDEVGMREFWKGIFILIWLL